MWGLWAHTDEYWVCIERTLRNKNLSNEIERYKQRYSFEVSVNLWNLSTFTTAYEKIKYAYIEKSTNVNVNQFVIWMEDLSFTKKLSEVVNCGF